MSTTLTWNGTSYSIPATGELNWGALSAFLIDLGNNGQTTNFQKFAARIATSSPVTVSAANDCVVVTNLSVAGAVAVNLPAGVTKQMFVIVDGKGDAATNNITITPAAGNINGASTYVINVNRAGVAFIYNGTEWTIFAEFGNTTSGTGTIPRNKIAAGTAAHVIINDGSGFLSSEAQLAGTRGGTGVSNAGTLTFGANAITFTTSGVTSVTLPTTGTVATLAGSESLSNKTLASPLISGGSIDTTAAGALAIGASVGANNLTLGGGTSTVVVSGNLTVSGTTTTVNSTTLDVADKNITVNNGGNDAASEGAGIKVDRTSTDGSFIYKDASASKFAIGALGSELDVVSTSSTQTLSNKTLDNTSTIAVKDTLFSIQDAATATKTIAFDPGGTAATKTTFAAAQTVDRVITAPDATTTILGHDTVQVVTAKDIDGGTASNTSRFTLPKAATATLTALTRKQGTIVYDTDLNKPYYDDGATLTAIGSGGGGGINYISANPDAEAGTTGWATYADAAGTTPVDGTGGSPNVTITALASGFSGTFTVGGDNPLRGTKSFQLLKDAANRQGQGVSYAFTMDRSDISKPLKISMDFSANTAYTASDLGIYIYDVTGAVLITPSSVNIPAGNGKLEVTFNATTSLSYRLIIHVQTVNATSYALKFDNVSVSPNVLVQGAAIGDKILDANFTPNNFGTVTLQSIYRKQVGDLMVVTGKWSSGTTAAGTASISLPSGFTIDSSKFSAGANLQKVGMWTRFSSGSTSMYAGNNAGDLFYDGSDTSKVYFALAVASNSYTKINASTIIATSDPVGIEFTVPISTWTSNTNLANSRVEFSSNSSSTNTSDTTSFSYGPSGELHLASTPAGDSIAKRVRFQNAIQPTDVFTCEVSADRLKWVPLPGATSNICEAMRFDGTNFFGIGNFEVINTTDVDVKFGKYRGGATTAWSGTGYWRLRKSSGIGAGEVAPVVPNATTGSSGYVDGVNGLKGFTDGSTATAGYLGESIEYSLAVASATGVTSNTLTNIISGIFSAGTWEFYSYMYINQPSGTPVLTFLQQGLSTTSVTMPTGTSSTTFNEFSTSNWFPHTSGPTLMLPSGPTRVNFTTATTVYLVVRAIFATGTISAAGKIRAVRIR